MPSSLLVIVIYRNKQDEMLYSDDELGTTKAMVSILTPMRFSNRSLGVIGMLPPALPNFFSNDCCTLSVHTSNVVVFQKNQKQTTFMSQNMKVVLMICGGLAY